MPILDRCNFGVFLTSRFSIFKVNYGSFKLGIRREGKNRWERRTPLVPSDVEQMLSSHSDLSVIIQPCTKRCYPNESYKQVFYNRFNLPFQAGATIEENLADCDMILGLKEIPVNEIIPKTSYLYFSHSHKGQLHNIPVLKNILSKVHYKLS